MKQPPGPLTVQSLRMRLNSRVLLLKKHTPCILVFLCRGKHRAKNLSASWWAPRLTLAAVACLYGTNYTAIKFMGDYLETSDLLTLRFGLSSSVLLPALIGIRRGVLLAGVEVGVYAMLGYAAQAVAMRVSD